jgi:hypothetical protein
LDLSVFTLGSLTVFPSHLLPLSPFCSPALLCRRHSSSPGRRRAVRRLHLLLVLSTRRPFLLPVPALPLLAIPCPATSAHTSRMAATHLRRALAAVLWPHFNCLCPELCDPICYPSFPFPGHPRSYPHRNLAFCFGSKRRHRPAPVGSPLSTPWVFSGGLGGQGWVLDRGKGSFAPAPRPGWPERALPPWPSRGHGAPPSSRGLRPSRGVATVGTCSGGVGDAPWPPN